MKAWLSLLLSLAAGACAPIGRAAPEPAAAVQARSLVNQGVTLLRAGELEKANAVFSLAYEVAPVAEALDGLGCVAFKRGNLDEARALFISAVKHSPGYSEGYANLARVYELQGLLQQAAYCYRRALLHDPKNFRARNNFGAYLYERDYKALAREQLLKASAVVRERILEDNLKKTK